MVLRSVLESWGEEEWWSICLEENLKVGKAQAYIPVDAAIDVTSFELLCQQ